MMLIDMLKTNKILNILTVLFSVFAVYFSLPSIFYNKNAKFLPNNKINFGLDLKGGVSLSVSADVEDYINENIKLLLNHLKKRLAKNNIEVYDWTIDKHEIKFFCNRSEEGYEIAKRFLSDITYNIKLRDGCVVIKLDDNYIKKLSDEVLEHSLNILRKRIDNFGNKDIELQKLGNDMIIVQLPGEHNSNSLRKLIGKTAKVSFHIVLDEENLKNPEKKIFSILHSKLLKRSDEKGFLVVEDSSVMTGDMIGSVFVDYGKLGEPLIKFTLTSLGAEIFADVTEKYKGKMLAIVMDNKIISAPLIKETIITGEGVISGNFTKESAAELAILLRAGALPVPLTIVEERVIGPTLGEKSIKDGVKSCIIAMILVSLVMLVYYRSWGFFANIALLIYFCCLIAILSLFNATLTLTGIAGIVLSLGMAVDANVLIFERIKEEIQEGKSFVFAFEQGYKSAFGAILDSNITTVVSGLMLYIFASGPVRGFAITLVVGTLCSMFSAIAVTKLLIKYSMFKNR